MERPKEKRLAKQMLTEIEKARRMERHLEKLKLMVIVKVKQMDLLKDWRLVMRWVKLKRLGFEMARRMDWPMVMLKLREIAMD